MRRNTIVLMLVALLGLPGIVAAQAFPPELNGDGAVQGDVVRLVPFDYYNLPYSLPDPDLETAWLTDIQVQVLPPYDIRVEQICLLMNGECWLPPAFPVADYSWRSDIGSYCNTINMPDGNLRIDCYTLVSDRWMHYNGALEFTGHPPQWYDWDWYVLDVELAEQQRPVPYRQPATQATE